MSITEMNSPAMQNTHKPQAREAGTMNAAQMQALQEAARKLGEDVALRKWCIEQAVRSMPEGTIATTEGGTLSYAVVHLADQIHRFIVGQSGSS